MCCACHKRTPSHEAELNCEANHVRTAKRTKIILHRYSTRTQEQLCERDSLFPRFVLVCLPMFRVANYGLIKLQSINSSTIDTSHRLLMRLRRIFEDTSMTHVCRASPPAISYVFSLQCSISRLIENSWFLKATMMNEMLSKSMRKNFKTFSTRKSGEDKVLCVSYTY